MRRIATLKRMIKALEDRINALENMKVQSNPPFVGVMAAGGASTQIPQGVTGGEVRKTGNGVVLNLR